MHRVLTSPPSFRSQHRVARPRIGDCEEALPCMRRFGRRSLTQRGAVGLVVVRMTNLDLHNDRCQEARLMS